MICAAVGVALVYDIAGLPKVICKYFGQETCTSQSAATVLIVVELYYFMNFGQYVTAFLEARSFWTTYLMHMSVMSRGRHAPLPTQRFTKLLRGLLLTRSAFGSWAPLRVAYFILFLVVVATGQAAALFLLFRGYGVHPISLLLGAAALVPW